MLKIYTHLNKRTNRKIITISEIIIIYAKKEKRKRQIHTNENENAPSYLNQKIP